MQRRGAVLDATAAAAMAVPVEHGVGVEVTPALTAAAGEAAWAVDWREALAGGTPAVSVPMVAAPSQPAVGFASEDWVSVRDNEGLLDILDSLKAAHSRLMGQPTPPGAYDLPPAVVLLSASGEAAAAEAAGKEYKTDHRNRQHVESVAPLGALASGARATELLLQPARGSDWSGQWVELSALWTPRRLIVLCGGGGADRKREGEGRSLVALVQAHPWALSNTAALELVSPASEAECAARGLSDSFSDVWGAMEDGAPLLVLDAVWATTRRVRKQLLHRLSKQPVAAQYVWQALPAAPIHLGTTAPTLEEGWAAVLKEPKADGACSPARDVPAMHPL